VEDLMNEIENHPEHVEAVQDGKGEKKRLKKLEAVMETGVLSPWERYRILIDESEHQTDLVEMADRKSRFALVIVATLNTVNFIAVIRPELLSGGAIPSAAVLAFYVTFYTGLSLYLCVQAVGTLRPRLFGSSQKRMENETAVPLSQQVLSINTMTREKVEAYYELWRNAQFGQVNREIAMRVQVTGHIITLKYRALERLYSGLLVLVFLTGLLIVGLTYLRLA
jgi:hypothetical protein